MDTVVQTLNNLLGHPPIGFEWLTYVVGSIIVLVAFVTFCNILSFVFSMFSSRRR